MAGDIRRLINQVIQNELTNTATTGLGVTK